MQATKRLVGGLALGLLVVALAQPQAETEGPEPGRSAPAREWTNSLGMEFVSIPAGGFVMGSPEDEKYREDDERQHEVRISRGFWMGKYEELMGENPSYFRACGERCPVDRVAWNDVQRFIQKLNGRESGSGFRYRLPSEAEWEYAARAGTPWARYGYWEESAWSFENSGEVTHPVGMKRANAWGLHDMLGVCCKSPTAREIHRIGSRMLSK